VDLRDRLVNRFHPNEGDLLELDFSRFTTTPLRFVIPQNIGKGCSISTVIYPASCFKIPGNGWRAYLVCACINTTAPSLINGRIQSQQQLSDQVKKALTL